MSLSHAKLRHPLFPSSDPYFFFALPHLQTADSDPVRVPPPPLPPPGLSSKSRLLGPFFLRPPPFSGRPRDERLPPVTYPRNSQPAEAAPPLSFSAAFHSIDRSVLFSPRGDTQIGGSSRPTLFCSSFLFFFPSIILFLTLLDSSRSTLCLPVAALYESDLYDVDDKRRRRDTRRPDNTQQGRRS